MGILDLVDAPGITGSNRNQVTPQTTNAPKSPAECNLRILCKPASETALSQPGCIRDEDKSITSYFGFPFPSVAASRQHADQDRHAEVAER